MHVARPEVNYINAKQPVPTQSVYEVPLTSLDKWPWEWKRGRYVVQKQASTNIFRVAGVDIGKSDMKSSTTVVTKFKLNYSQIGKVVDFVFMLAQMVKSNTTIVFTWSEKRVHITATLKATKNYT